MHTPSHGRPPAGYSMIEFQVAMVLLGIALAGIFPLLVMQSRQLKNLEARFQPGTTYYLSPATSTWTRKLGAGATFLSQAPPARPVAPTLLLDNSSSSGYSETGSGWQTETSSGAYGGTDRTHVAGSGQNSAAWLFTGLQPGWYTVLATWATAAGRASNAPYTIWDGTTSRGTYPIDQTQPPIGWATQGQPWQSVATVPIRGTTLQVILTDKANGVVAADAIQIVPLRNTVQVGSFSRTLTDDAVSATVSVNVVTPQ